MRRRLALARRMAVAYGNLGVFIGAGVASIGLNLPDLLPVGLVMVAIAWICGVLLLQFDLSACHRRERIKLFVFGNLGHVLTVCGFMEDIEVAYMVGAGITGWCFVEWMLRLRPLRPLPDLPMCNTTADGQLLN